MPARQPSGSGPARKRQGGIAADAPRSRGTGAGAPSGPGVGTGVGISTGIAIGAGVDTGFVAGIKLRAMAARAILAAGLATLSACGTLTEPTEQYVMMQTVLDHQQVAGIGCVLTNDMGRWFVTSPGRVQIRKSRKPLVVDCRRDELWTVDEIGPRQNASRWGNILLTAGAGQLIDRQTGAGFDYPTTLTVLLKRIPPAAAPAAQPAGQPGVPPPEAQALPPTPQSSLAPPPSPVPPSPEQSLPAQQSSSVPPSAAQPAPAPQQPGGSVIY